MNTRIHILGAGVMGTAFSFPLADSGVDVTLCGTHLDDDLIDAVRDSGIHPGLEHNVPESVRAVNHRNMPAAFRAPPDLIVLGVSSAGIPWAIETLGRLMQKPTPILLLTKGLAVAQGRITTLAEDVQHGLAQLRGWTPQALDVGGVGGPCIARELADRRPTCVCIGAAGRLIDVLRDALATHYYRVEYTPDVTGVELAAALKNMMAIGVGTANGLEGLSSFNRAAAIFSQAVTELELLTRVLGGQGSTVRGLAGVGDLYVTCQAGRNSRLGRMLGAGVDYHDARARMQDETVEGADLALLVGPVLRSMIAGQTIDGKSLPLTLAILQSICDGQPFSYTGDHPEQPEDT